MSHLPPIFNCSNDMALAANVKQYFPPKRIQQMEDDLATLASYWEQGPWGWSLATKQRYKKMGISEQDLPTDEWIENMRKLSSREFACRYIVQMLADMGDDRLLGHEMTFLRDVAKVQPQPYPLIFKSPWSSSGRGVFVAEALDEHTLRRLNGFVTAQGGFALDKFHRHKVLDFAMEFNVGDDSEVEFLGYSVFHAAESGAYGYNLVASQETLLQMIDLDERLLSRLIDYHKEHLANLGYQGPVGIDMIKCADGTVHPCIEINLRMNMGILALRLWQRFKGSPLNVALTPRRESGFQAVIDEGRLMITYKPPKKP